MPHRCRTSAAYALPFLLLAATHLLVAPAPAAALQDAPFLAAGVPSALPVVVPNDNRTPAGAERGGVREITLTVLRADWRVESDAGPGLRVAAVAEGDGPPRIPAPLVRVGETHRLRVTVRNTLDADVTVFGLHTRPTAAADSFVVAAGGEHTVEFEAGAPGTYLYWMREGPPPSPDVDPSTLGEREQLAGAFVVDPDGAADPDRVFVVNIFSEPVDTTVSPVGWVEGLAINGRSWPYTELQRLEVGAPVRWRVVNASTRDHPMHLHGFYFQVQSRGTVARDTLYALRDRRMAVTEPMMGRTTMLVEWTPTRPGRWLFHCHLSFHVTAGIRLPGALEADPEHAHSHMAGLVLGIEVAPGPTDLVAEGPPLEVDLYANEYGDVPGFRYGFAHTPDAAPDSLTEAPGPVLVFNQHRAVDVTVHNTMSAPTGVHWHGLELDAWADGVPDWSASDGRVSPVIPPGGRFTYRLSLMRPGTFIYHSHLNDIDQLTGGLYGALVVLPPGEAFDPTRDHVRIWGWNDPDADGPEDMDLGGRRLQPDAEARVGEPHRFRLINIAPAGNLTAWITRDGAAVPITLHAKDGADLPPHQRVPVDRMPRFGVGETADFVWIPTEAGEYLLHIGYDPEAALVQRWIVRE